MTRKPERFEQPPPGWGVDQLTSFVQCGVKAAWASFIQPATRLWFEKLRDIDSSYTAALQALNGPTPNFFVGLMLASAHAAFRSAAQFSLEGRTCEAMVLLRNCLEHGMYGVHFHCKPELIEIWSRRGDGVEQRQAVRNHFKTNKMLGSITSLNYAVSSRCKELHELTIDMGAHPNELGFYGRISIETSPSSADKTFKVKYLSGADAAHLASLKIACQVGVCVLECFNLVYKEQFDLARLSSTIDSLKLDP